MGSDLLIFSSMDRICALDTEQIEEVLRPLPVTAVAGIPPFILGVSVVRGEPVPVVDLGQLLSGIPLREATRLISLRIGNGRKVGLLVGHVLGLRSREALPLGEVPPLLQDVTAGVLEAMGRLDGALLSVLRLGHVIPEDLWDKLKEEEE